MTVKIGVLYDGEVHAQMDAPWFDNPEDAALAILCVLAGVDVEQMREWYRGTGVKIVVEADMPQLKAAQKILDALPLYFSDTDAKPSRPELKVVE